MCVSVSVCVNAQRSRSGSVLAGSVNNFQSWSEGFRSSLARANASRPGSDMDQRRGLLELLCLVLLGWTLVRGQAETDLKEDGEAEDAPGIVENVEQKIFCPENCSCTEEGAVDCNGASLNEFPHELSEQTRQLSLQVRGFVCILFTQHVFSEYFVSCLFADKIRLK